MVRADTSFFGAPLRFLYTPHPVVSMPPSVLRGYIEGRDPVTGRPLVEEVLEALTLPYGADESRSLAVVRPAPRRERLLAPDTEENLRRVFMERGWSDGLPFILPTEERVAAMLAGTGQAPDRRVGKSLIVDTQEDLVVTVETVAVAAVMAGAGPEHLPVLLAVASTGQPAIQPSTLPFTSALLVNGPIRKAAGMNSGMGALGPYSPANAVIGRAWTLMSILWGYARPKQTFWTSQGNNYTYNNLCMAENEERSVWEPFHVQKGHRREESVVSLFRGWNLINSTGAASRRSWGDEVRLQMQALPALYSGATLILDPILARHLKEHQGFETPMDVGRWIAENVTMTAGQFWGNDIIDMLVTPLALHGVQPYADWKKLPDDAVIAPYHKPGKINVLVVGGETSPLWKISDLDHTVSVPVDKWMARPSDAARGKRDPGSEESRGAYESSGA
ncbi:MAG: hypothetical protein JW793_14360 [Acidobacteria bacterium]|nr:hypothetical protein [Acidobacteriota bacterium]